MQYSSSLGSFLHPNIRKVPVSRQLRARSSLDTFLIPGRTRVPSTKPEPIDFEVAHRLLRNNMVRTVHVQSASSADENARILAQTSRTPSSNDPVSPKMPEEPPYFLQPIHYDFPPDTPPKRSPAAREGAPKATTPVRPRRKTLQPGRHPLQVLASPSHGDRTGYDGTLGSSYESRMTSMTWSSVSHRVFTDSSSSSQGVGPFEALGQYNHLATRNGIPELTKCPGDTHFEEKTTRKVHHNGWLARKIFRRSSSTFTLEVRASQRPVTRKMSLAKMPKLGEGERRNILHDKSLEEMSRLGGLGILSLPPEFAVDKMTLPTCLSAVATYLFQEGRNMPGLFRLSGQSAVVTQLYDFYAYQFSQAGSPSKVRETVGSGLLPAHLEYSIHDVASFFKKVLISLPGGLLGSLDLFEAFRNIFFNLNPDPEVSDVEADKIRAKLVALAITSAISQYRVYLIQAVLGLFAYLAHEAEAEKARSEERRTAAEGKERSSSSELMGYQSLGVVLGPLLLGTLMDDIELTVPNPEGDDRASTESSRKAARKVKRTSLTAKLDRNALLSAHVDRANLTANVMELLLMLWKDVVVQLRQLNAARNISPPPQDQNAKLKKSAKATGSRLTLRGSEEDLMFMNVLRGRALPDDLSGQVKSKRRVKITSRSPISRRVLSASESDLPRQLSQRIMSDSVGLGDKQNRKVDNTSLAEESQASEPAHPVRTVMADSNDSIRSGLGDDQRSTSDVAMEEMSMGTILPRLQDSPITPLHKELLRPHLPTHAKKSEMDDVSSDSTRDTVASNALRDSEVKSEIQEPLVNKPLPSIGRAQWAEHSSPVSEEDGYERLAVSATFPARESSLPANKKLPPRPRGRVADAVLEQSGQQYGSVLPAATGSRGGLSGNAAGSTNSANKANGGSVKFLTQRFTEASRANRKAQEKDKGLFRVFARIQDMEGSRTPSGDEEDSFVASTNASPPRNTLIPRPVQDVGSGRRILNKSPSPPKTLSPSPSKTLSPSVPKNLSPFTLNFDYSRGTEYPDNMPFRSGARSSSPHDKFARKSVSNASLIDQVDVGSVRSRASSGNFLGVAPTRSLSVYSSDSIRRSQLEEDPPVASHRAISFDVNARDDRVTTSLRDTGMSGSETVPLRRSPSINATLIGEITQLKRLLEQKTAELDSAKRSLDAIRDAREGINPNLSALNDEGAVDQVTAGAGNIGSVKGTLSEQVRILRKKRNEWKKRAEWAEGRLAALEGSDGKAGQASTEARED